MVAPVPGLDMRSPLFRTLLLVQFPVFLVLFIYGALSHWNPILVAALMASLMSSPVYAIIAWVLWRYPELSPQVYSALKVFGAASAMVALVVAYALALRW
jgi:hypothetical protein